MIRTKTKRGPARDLRSLILERITATPNAAWTPADFSDLGPRGAIDMALTRLVAADEIRRFARGLYDKPWSNTLTAKPSAPDVQATIEAITRRDGLRYVVDGMTAANALGLTDAVPARTVVHVDARLGARKLGSLAIEFRTAPAATLAWAGRPAMRLVQAMAWLRDTLDRDRARILAKVARLLRDQPAIREDLKDGFRLLPVWMQELLRELVFPRDPRRAPGRAPSRDPGRNPGRDPGREPGRDPGRGAGPARIHGGGEKPRKGARPSPAGHLP